MARPAILAVDLGTGSVRAGLVGPSGRLLCLSSVPHETSFPRHGWVEQRPEDWWSGAVLAIRGAMSEAPDDVELRALVACGQMHAPVLVDAGGRLTADTVPLWNDKRAAQLVADLTTDRTARLRDVANPMTTAWPGIKLAWMTANAPQVLERARWLLMPKDYLNFRLTGLAAMDWTEAGSSVLADMAGGVWSPDLAAALGVPFGLLPPLLPSHAQLGRLLPGVAEEIGLPAHLPVLVGAGDFPAAMLGSGVAETGQVSDITGTSFLLTRLVDTPFRHPQVMNVATASGHWGAFAVVDAAGDAIRWAARTLDGNRSRFEDLSRAAEAVPAGAEGLVFMPYLTGERLGQGSKSRAHFLGLTAQHGPAHLHRAVMEGVVLAMQEAFAPVREALPVSTIRSSAGGARSDLWLQIKADVFGVPILPTREPEAGLLGCAMLALTGAGEFGSLAEAARHLVSYRDPVEPDPARRLRYADLAAAYAELRVVSPTLNESLGRLS
ncbi:MAG: FGGY family carbohydrate kinase [Alsobacter sp.]